MQRVEWKGHNVEDYCAQSHGRASGEDEETQPTFTSFAILVSRHHPSFIILVFLQHAPYLRLHHFHLDSALLRFLSSQGKHCPSVRNYRVTSLEDGIWTQLMLTNLRQVQPSLAIVTRRTPSLFKQQLSSCVSLKKAVQPPNFSLGCLRRQIYDFASELLRYILCQQMNRRGIWLNDTLYPIYESAAYEKSVKSTLPLQISYPKTDWDVDQWSFYDHHPHVVSLLEGTSVPFQLASSFTLPQPGMFNRGASVEELRKEGLSSQGYSIPTFHPDHDDYLSNNEHEFPEDNGIGISLLHPNKSLLGLYDIDGETETEMADFQFETSDLELSRALSGDPWVPQGNEYRWSIDETIAISLLEAMEQRDQALKQPKHFSTSSGGTQLRGVKTRRVTLRKVISKILRILLRR
ncbi:hypothetical protein AMATHDRAFT_1128 [Amanita thiersii Skay4041]|uniref:Uncharacterized protein n=1 Tax=Amanita thiersii Skay4041 TaxID=703135 RepID=A0A2A9NZF8_9AGAR|nr:hypothetical protein AMATHDRAFT_1128 [Amanita thiersii Skay4041]